MMSLDDVMKVKRYEAYFTHIIDQVRLYLCLWDTSCPAFRKMPEKRKASQNMSLALQTEDDYFSFMLIFFTGIIDLFREHGLLNFPNVFNYFSKVQNNKMIGLLQVNWD